MPHSTRKRIARALAMLKSKTAAMPRRKHDSLPVRGDVNKFHSAGRVKDAVAISIIAGAMVPLLMAYKENNKELKRYFRQIIDLMCRKIENFVEPRVSKAAWAKAQELGIADLRSMHWNDQPTKMKDSGRQIFHWEHVVPVETIRRHVLDVAEPTPDIIAGILAGAEVAWILKSENEKLDSRGYRIKRTDPRACYAECGIEFFDDG